MKKTSQEFMEWLGLKVGDRVRTKDNFTFEVCKNNFYFLKGINIPESKGLEFLIDLDVDILPRPKRVGDLKCSNEIKCEQCPLRLICEFLDFVYVDSLYNVLEIFKENEFFDQEIYDLMKTRLDKEVEDNE